MEGVSLVNRRYKKGVPFLSKEHIKGQGVRPQVLGREGEGEVNDRLL